MSGVMYVLCAVMYVCVEMKYLLSSAKVFSHFQLPSECVCACVCVVCFYVCVCK